MSNQTSNFPAFEPDPVIEAYKEDVDRTLIRENLRLSVEERFRKHQKVVKFFEDLRGAPTGLPFGFDEPTVGRGLNFTLVTTAGDFDALGEITGGGSFEELAAKSVRLPLYAISGFLLRAPRRFFRGIFATPFTH